MSVPIHLSTVNKRYYIIIVLPPRAASLYLFLLHASYMRKNEKLHIYAFTLDFENISRLPNTNINTAFEEKINTMLIVVIKNKLFLPCNYIGPKCIQSSFLTKIFKFITLTDIIWFFVIIYNWKRPKLLNKLISLSNNTHTIYVTEHIDFRLKEIDALEQQMAVLKLSNYYLHQLKLR